MRRILLTAALTMTFVTPTAIASADAGSPGSTYPEAPGTNVADACAAVAAAPAVGGGTSNNTTAFGIVAGLLVDACGGG